MESIYEINLMPIEPLLFSDNRSARAGEDHAIREQDPSPHTIYGAVGKSIIELLGGAVDSRYWNNHAEVRECLGDFQADIKNSATNRSELVGFVFSDVSGNLWFPRPLHVRLNQRYKEGSIRIGKSMKLRQINLQSKDVSTASLPGFDHYLDYEEDNEEIERDDHISSELLEKILCGQNITDTDLGIAGREQDRLPLEKIYKPESRLGLGMNYQHNRTKSGRLFSRPYRRFVSEVDWENGKWKSASITAWFKTLQPMELLLLAGKRVAFLGGDGGRAIIQFIGDKPLLSKPLQDIRKAVQTAAGQSDGFFCYLLTPAVREKEWPPTIKSEGESISPIAAAIGKEITASGWNANPADQYPRPILRLIPAGSTFFYRWPKDNNEDQRKALIEKYWLEPVTAYTSEHYRNSGFGRMLIGVWRHEQ